MLHGVPATRVALWSVDRDVIWRDLDYQHRGYRTIIAASGNSPPRGSIVLCGEYFFDPTPTVAALGKVQHVQAVSTGRVRARVEPFLILDDPIDLDRIRLFLDHQQNEAIDEATYADPVLPTLFSPRSSESLILALRSASIEASACIDELLAEHIALPPSEELRLQEERDAVATAVRFADMSRNAYSTPSRRNLLQPGMPLGLSLSRSHLIDNEDDLIAADLRRFDDRARLRDLTGSIFEITDEKLRLTVMNVNRKDLETVYGVDLIYYDHINDKAIALQYKRMEQVSVASSDRTGYEWAYRKKSDLEKQLDLMKPHSVDEATSAQDWRLSSSPNFFKFIREQSLISDSKMLLSGMYVPDEYLRLGIAEGRYDSGSRGGFRITKRNIKYFNSETFIELVRRCWIGTRNTDRSGLVDYARARAQDHEMVIAVRSARTF